MKKSVAVSVCVVGAVVVAYALVNQFVLSAKADPTSNDSAAVNDPQYPTVIDWDNFFNSLSEQDRLIYTVAPGDSLGKIAKNFGTTPSLIKRVNQLKSDSIYAGQKLKLWKATFSVSVLRAKNILLLTANDKVVKMYPVSTGKIETGTPVGVYTVKTKLVDPVWYHGGKVYPPGHPENGLGSRWLGLDLEGYGIHGTIHPDLIGQPVSAGCVRMLNQDVEELYDIIPTGIKVVIN